MSLFSLCSVASLSILSPYCSPDLRVFPFCPTAHENRRGGEPERGHQLHLNKEEAPADPHGTAASLLTFIFSTLIPDWAPADALNEPAGRQKEFADRCFFWCKMLTAIVAVNRRHSAGERRSTQALLSFNHHSTPALVFVKSNLHWHF